MNDEKDLTRRQFIEGSAGVAAVLTVGCGSDSEDAGAADTAADTSSAGDSGSAEDSGTTPADAVDADALDSSKVVVAIVGTDADILAEVRRAVELAGGLDAIQPGDTVFIKPNAVHGFAFGAPAITTANDLLAAVITLVKERSPGKITVGDRSARFFDSASVFDSTGMAETALESGADEVFAAPTPTDAPEEWELVQPPKFDETWSEEGGVLVMKRMVAADHLINLPVCKNHRWAGFSLAMKNFIGGIGDESRDPMHYITEDADKLSRDIAILNQPFSPMLNILDARSVLVNGGPEGVDGDAVRFEANLIMASTDRVAVDAVGAALIQHGLTQVTVDKPDPMHTRLTTSTTWQLPQFIHAIDIGIDTVTGPEDMQVALENVPTELEAAIRTRVGL